ncbi:SPOR domain-containing protein [Emticicia sp. BO119]|uniref:SPOR domain-containing protein n=1 Tax=Emticicia sp. BO119 TaxID=2757768 RepID=UPI0015EFEE4C|nr:SPOR domain-containing protein [Emticicia sp. BO119]MBA4851813.1 SPOR domain-containing protein [Emticicia sp. BO119]
MKIFPKIVFCLLLTGVFYSCKRAATPTKSTSIGEYEEDLSPVRLTYDKKPDIDTNDGKVKRDNVYNAVKDEIPMNDNKEVDKALDSMSIHNKNIRYSAGYRIQVYVGNERKEVDEARSYIYQNFPDLNVYLTFSQPTYRLKAGDFTSRMDAERYYNSIRQRYSMAMIVPERIDIRKSMQIR